MPAITALYAAAQAVEIATALGATGFASILGQLALVVCLTQPTVRVEMSTGDCRFSVRLAEIVTYRVWQARYHAGPIHSRLTPTFSMQEHEQLSSGKVIARQFDADGRLLSEGHMYGLLDIGITIEFSDGVKVGEWYFVKRRTVPRNRYHKARADYPDMPPSDSEVRDIGGEVARAARAERRQRLKAAKEHVRDTQHAARIDAFCRSMLDTGKHADARMWIESPKNSLGEHSHAKSRAIIDRLIRTGARTVHACDIDCYDDGEENTGHLVVELPGDLESRRRVLREVDQLASLQGLVRDFDDGQRFAYVKLD